MKTRKQIQKEIPNCTVMTLNEFIKDVKRGYLTPYDGYGYFHDGDKETDRPVMFGYGALVAANITYPYVCWYNK